MTSIELIGVPFDGYGRAGHQAAAAAVLAEAGLTGAGLADALTGHHVVEQPTMVLPAAEPRRGELTSLINEAALVAMTTEVGQRVVAVTSAGRFPIVHGGDCTTLLGIVPALCPTRRPGRPAVEDAQPVAERVGLLFVDGHEDTMPLDVSEDGEAANAELGLLLGLTGRLLRGPLAERLGRLDDPPTAVLDRREVAVLGPRDGDWRRRFNVGSLRGHGVWFRDATELAANPGAAARAAVAHLRTTTPRWWLHVDLDVLDPEVLGSQGLPDVPDDPGGLSWEELTRALTTAVAQGGCLGFSVAIYDPEQDPYRRDARRIVDLVARVAASLPGP